MKFAHFSHIWRKPGMTPGARYAQLWREVELADSLGYDYGFTVEHHADPNESLSVSPPMYIAGAAARTKRMRLGAMGWLVPLYDPLRVAEEVVSLDNLLEGRLDVGLVSGALPPHFTPYKADFENRRDLAIEGYEVLKAAFANPDGFSYKGPYHEYDNVALQMHPVQTPLPPIWFETRFPPALEYLAQEGIQRGLCPLCAPGRDGRALSGVHRPLARGRALIRAGHQLLDPRLRGRDGRQSVGGRRPELGVHV
jgi:alkanesulfonate monooxygenase SsuD/methylene tetrahydromethanopterin reductase-like flavin-dependent oxidoreductase (luciferase family)